MRKHFFFSQLLFFDVCFFTDFLIAAFLWEIVSTSFSDNYQYIINNNSLIEKEVELDVISYSLATLLIGFSW